MKILAFFNIVLITTSIFIVPQNICFADTQSATNFYQGHNISVLLGFHHSDWNFIEVGEIQNQSEREWNQSISFKDAFYFSFYKRFGYYVGWGLRFNYDIKSNQAVDVGHSFSFPSMSAGVVYQNSNISRFGILGEYEAIWYKWMRSQSLEGPSKKLRIEPILDGFGLAGSWDIFYQENMAITVVSGVKRIWNWCVSQCNSNTMLGNLKLTNNEFFFQFGITRYFGEDIQ